MISLIIAALVNTALLVILLRLHFDLRQTKQSMHRQVQLMDAYAWEVESNRYVLKNTIEQLRNAHEHAIELNQKLESEVNNRTQLLDHQTKKIVEYHFINAHTLRAPLARILGLISIFDFNEANTQNQIVIERLLQEGREFDKIVHNIQQTLYCAESTNILDK